MLKRILVTAFLGAALVFTVPSCGGCGRPWQGPGPGPRSSRLPQEGPRSPPPHGGYNKGYRRGYRHGYRDGYRDDYYYYGYNRSYGGRCYYRDGYRYYYDNGYGCRYCDDYYYRHGYRVGALPLRLRLAVTSTTTGRGTAGTAEPKPFSDRTAGSPGPAVHRVRLILRVRLDGLLH